MKLWLILLGVATVLTIALRRVRRRQAPLDDELYAKRIAVDYVHSGVAWVRADGTFGSVNQSLAKTFGLLPSDFAGREWYRIFPAADETRLRGFYSQVMLMGMVDFEATAERAGGSPAYLRVRLVAVHDGHMRFVGHHCLIEDKTREHELEQHVHLLEQRVQEFESRGRAASQSVISALNNARKAREAEESPIGAAR